MKKGDDKVASNRAGGTKGVQAHPQILPFIEIKPVPTKYGLVSKDIMVLIVSPNFGTKTLFENFLTNHNFDILFLIEFDDFVLSRI